MASEEEVCAYAVQLVSSSVLPMVLHTALELNLLEIISRAGPDAHLTPSEIAAHLPTKNPDAPAMLDRILRLLSSYSVVTSSVDDRKNRVYGLAPVAKYLIRNEDGVSLAPIMNLFHDKVFMATWYKLGEAVLEGGIPFNKVHGVHSFEYPGLDLRFNKVFNDAMFDHTTIFVKKILESYDGFEQLKQVVDVGGGLGVALSIITSKYPTIKGINFDLPHVIKDAPTYPNIEHVAGDMFETVPRGEVIFMKWILHDWDDDHCLKLLKNCYLALPENGKVIVAETILSEAPETTASANGVSQFDVQMMTQNTGGKERTESEFRDLAIKAGFASVTMKCCVFNFWVMEFHK